MRIETADDGRTASGGLFQISELAQQPSIERALSAVRELLGMDVVYATEFVDANQVFRFINGDPISFGVSATHTLPLGERMLCERSGGPSRGPAGQDLKEGSAPVRRTGLRRRDPQCCGALGDQLRNASTSVRR